MPGHDLVHQLVRMEAALHERAARALDVFVYRVGRELGSLAAALVGLDALVFTAGIGEHAPSIRAHVCRDAAWLGLRFDEAANDGGGPCISAADSPATDRPPYAEARPRLTPSPALRLPPAVRHRITLP